MDSPKAVFSYLELRQEAERELLRRKRVLPNRILTGRRGHKVNRELQMMAAIVCVLREHESAEQLPLAGGVASGTVCS